jgi:hypothetical protein
MWKLWRRREMHKQFWWGNLRTVVLWEYNIATDPKEME